MDGLDLFRKLGVGVKFNFKRFKADAENLKIIKPQEESAADTDDLTKVQDGQETVPMSAGKRKFSDTDMMSNDSESEGEVQIMTGVQKAKTQEKKKQLKTAQMAAKQRRIEVREFKHKHAIHTHGTDIPEPIESFQQLRIQYSMGERILQNVHTLGYEQPTPIQMQAITCMMDRREILASAPTGSGKTAAFLLPILHQLKAPQRKGFRALILAPTRELAQQTFRECNRLADGLGFKIHIIEKTSTAKKKFGLKSNQKFDILVTTPNRLVYLLKQDPPVISLSHVEWLVVDESDKLFEEGKTGFRDQLAVIYQACDGPLVRRAMFSATFTHDVEEWCKLNLDNVVQVYIGAKNHATELIKQELMFVGSESGKLMAVRELIQKGMSPPVLIFVQSKDRAKELFQELIYDGINVDVIHAERTQSQRDKVVTAFRSGRIWVLICTDLMGRGMDFKGVNLVINYDFPNSAISYIHRIEYVCCSIANVMKEAGCPVPEYMLKMAKPDKGRLKKLATSAIERKTIRTYPGADKIAARKKHIKKKLKSRFVSSIKPESGQENTLKTPLETEGTTQKSSSTPPQTQMKKKKKLKNVKKRRKQSTDGF